MKSVEEWALSKVGQGYIYGARGQTCTPAFRAQQAKQYPAQADMILGVGAKWDGTPVWDCAQLTRYAAKEGGVSLPSGATSQWRKADWARTGEIGSLPSGEVAFLYRQSGQKMSHTGISLGDGTFVHAKGTRYGVLHQRLEEYEWTHWAVPRWEQSDEELVALYEAVVTAESGKTVNLRESASKASRVVSKVPVGACVDVVEEGDSWARVRYGGETGYMMRQFMRKTEDAVEADDQDVLKTDGVTLEVLHDLLVKILNLVADLVEAKEGGANG